MSATKDYIEVNVTSASLTPVDSNPNLLRLRVGAETRLYESRYITAPYALRLSPNGDVTALANRVLDTCGKS